MKKFNLIFNLIVVALIVLSCEKTEISLNKAGDPASLSGTWVTANYINVTTYSANPANSNGDVTYNEITAIDSTKLAFSFGAVRVDSVQVIAVKRLNGKDQAPVKLPNGKWSFAIGTSSGDGLPGSTYFNIFQTAYPNNLVSGYGTIYTYSMKSPTSMGIMWVVNSGTPQNTITYKAVLNKN